MSLLKSTATIASLTMASRVLGFVRDVLIAGLLGASWLSDAFLIAFKLPNFFRRLFAEGAFNAAFVPQFSRLLAGEGSQRAQAFAGRIFSLLLIALLLLNALFITCMPWLLQWFAPGFEPDSQQYELTVQLARICFAYILCISAGALIAAILNSHKRFAVTTATQLLLNIALIGAVLFAADETQTPAHALSWGVFIAGILQFVWLAVCARRAGLFPALRKPALDPQVKRFFKLLGPAALGAGVAQINLLIDVILASFFAQGVSYLYFADRLNQLPIGVIGVAVGTALLPMLSAHYKREEMDKARHQMNRAIELVLLFALPAMVAFLMIPETLIRTLYEHGAFDADDTQATYHTLMAYACGLPAFLLLKVLSAGFYGNEDTQTPFKIAIICVLANLMLNLILMQYLAHVGLALATALSGWLNVVLMAWFLRKRGILRTDNALHRRVVCFMLAAMLMGGALWAMQHYANLPASLELAVMVPTGGILFFACVVLTGGMRPRELCAYLRKQ